MNRNDLADAVLKAIGGRNEAARLAPKPNTWRSWEIVAWELDRDFGPLYSPSWFGDLAATEAGRVRVLRAVYRLEAAGVVEVFKSEGGRLERVRLTKAGRRAVVREPIR